MSAIHILEQDDDKAIIAIFHIPVPAGNNNASKSWQDCIKEQAEKQQEGTISSHLPNIDAGELANLQSGALVEKSHTVRFTQMGLDNTTKRAEIEAAYTAQATSFIAAKQIELAWWGLALAAP